MQHISKNQSTYQNGGEKLDSLFAQFSTSNTPQIVGQHESEVNEQLPLSPYTTYPNAPNTPPNTPQWTGEAKARKQPKNTPQYEVARYEACEAQAEAQAEKEGKSSWESLVTLVTFSGCILVIAYLAFELVREYQTEIGLTTVVIVLVLIVNKLPSSNANENTQKDTSELQKSEQFKSVRNGSNQFNYNITVNHYQNDKGGENGI